MVDELFVSGRTLVFCDDTDIAGQPVVSLAPDLRILLALRMPSDGYPALDAAMAVALADFGVSEFHATDMASGKGEWAGRAIDERIAALDFLADRLEEHVQWVGAVWLPQGSYKAVRAEAEKIGKVGVGFKHGLKRAFVRSLIERLLLTEAQSIICLDQDRPLNGVKVEAWPEGQFLATGGPLSAPSHRVRGLQLADLATWSVQRHLRRPRGEPHAPAELGAGTPEDIAVPNTENPFDAVATRVVAAFPGKLHDLRGDEGVMDWEAV